MSSRRMVVSSQSEQLIPLRETEMEGRDLKVLATHVPPLHSNCLELCIPNAPTPHPIALRSSFFIYFLIVGGCGVWGDQLGHGHKS